MGVLVDLLATQQKDGQYPVKGMIGRQLYAPGAHGNGEGLHWKAICG
jgi:hypothetical protein